MVFFFKVHRQTEVQQSKNEKALYTTLMIVGSVVVGWMPACIQYYLICSNCVIQPDWANFTVRFYTYFLTNCLVILKSGINSYIYAARMQEIQVNMFFFITNYFIFFLNVYNSKLAIVFFIIKLSTVLKFLFGLGSDPKNVSYFKTKNMQWQRRNRYA